MDKFATENLILIEFLVDQVNFEHNVKKDLQLMSGETCVSFQFLDNIPILVSEEDFMPKKKNYLDSCTGCSNVKNGKSCLFSLTPSQAEEAYEQFDVYVEVYKKTRCGLTDKILIGESLISIVNLFKQLMESVMDGDTTSAKTLKNYFKLTNTATGEMVGNISVYIRMSCYGKLIVTQFQMNLDDKSVEFKAKEGHYLFRYNKKENKNDSCNNSAGDMIADSPPCLACPPSPCRPATAYSETPRNMQPQCCLPPSCCQIVTPPSQPPRRTPSCCPPASCYCLNCQSCPRCASCCTPPNCCCSTCMPQCIPAPQPCCLSMAEPCPRLPITAETIENNSVSYYPPPTCCSPCCVSSQQMTMHPTGDNEAPFTFRMGGCCKTSNNVSVSPPITTAQDGTKFTEISDPDQEMFILRVGKKCERSMKKNNVDLELCTPQRPPKIPPIELDTKRIQYSDSDLPAGYLERFYGKEAWEKIRREQGYDKNGRKISGGGMGYGNEGGKGGGINGRGGADGNGRGGAGGRGGKGGKHGKGGKDGKYGGITGGAMVYLEKPGPVFCCRPICNPCAASTCCTEYCCNY